MEQTGAWATSFLTQVLLRYLELHHPEEFRRIDFKRAFGGIDGFDRIREPQTLLSDGHSWLPEEVVRELLLQAERLTGRKDVAAAAAHDFFQRPEGRSPSIFELIARLVDDVHAVLLASGLWARVYTNYLRLQAIDTANAGGAAGSGQRQLVLLAQFPPEMRPLISMHYMLQGNIEGFPQLFPFASQARLEPRLLQFRIADIVAEFDGYRIEGPAPDLRVIERRSGRLVAAAQPVRLMTESVTVGAAAAEPVDASDAPIVAAQDGRLALLTDRPEPVRPFPDQTQAYQITQGGTLVNGSLRYEFQPGAIYDAPYSRYRFSWSETPRPVLEGAQLAARMQQVSLLLLQHLHQLKTTQQRLLAYAVENQALAVQNQFLRQELKQTLHDRTVIAASPAMEPVLQLVRQVAPTDSTVLISGETGTGKELVARLIHLNSKRRDQPFIALNCAALPDALLESELFGHERGAFTGAVGRRLGRFELASGGTLFLDEVGEVSPAVQVKLLRVLQEREIQRVGGEHGLKVDVRVIAATNQELERMLAAGTFRRDLYYRLNVIPIAVPPLRERTEDIAPLLEHFLRQFNAAQRKRLRRISPEALLRLKAYPWPGNVRELENLVERIVTL